MKKKIEIQQAKIIETQARQQYDTDRGKNHTTLIH
jgi:hypothetical protein